MSDQIKVEIIKDSISEDEVRLTTFQLSYHRFIHSELMTHRVFSRNASSSRAIPVEKLIKQVRKDPMMPVYWGSNKPGMQAGKELTESNLVKVKAIWKATAIMAADQAETLEGLHLHKQITNRILEPFLPIHVVLTTTELSNFFHLRDHKDAQPEFQELARKIKKAVDESNPKRLTYGEWHLPYVSDEELAEFIAKHGKTVGYEFARICSSARCARVAFLNHDKTNPTLKGDLKLYHMLATRPFNDGKGHVLEKDDPVHLSPLEHQATPMEMPYGTIDIMGSEYIRGITHVDCDYNRWSGNFRGWVQNRQLLDDKRD